ncbi:class I tRNA ligase family protein [Saccharothrix saharensis]|uniref:class I tRNA ligase family protein n=1 Tax=Saccharothrix saharensis TaxID=571190 RepID=UPI0036D16C71
MSTVGKNFIVTSAPPNPNGDLHLGHLSGPFLGADVLRRSLVQQGVPARYVSYADDYSCYVRRRAADLGHGTEETAFVYGRRMEETLALGGMLPDRFTHPQGEPLHTQLTQRYFLDLYNSGAFAERELPAFYCATCAHHLYEAEVTGICPHCGAHSGGLECEECARRLETTGLREPRCVTCGGVPEVRSLRRLVFPLEPHRAGLARFAAEGVFRPRLRAYLDDLLSRPLPEVPFSRLDPLGIPVPLPEWRGHVLDTWFGGIWGYLASTTAHAVASGEAASGEQLWKDPDTEVVHFLGFDCSFSHAVFWPGLLLAQGQLRLPTHVLTNEFYRLEGEKFSTSRGHAIWGGDFLRRVPADAVRFFLCLAGPEVAQTSFSLREFTDTTRTVLTEALQGWTDGVFARARGRVEGGGGGVTDPVLAEAMRLPEVVAGALAPSVFSPRAAAAAVRDVVVRLPHALDGDAPLSDHVEALARTAVAVAPLMPTWSELVLTALDVPPADPLHRTPPWPAAGARIVPPGRSIAPACPTPLSTSI